jgi:hypothetical protein
MKLVLKDNRVMATHSDDQSVTLVMYPGATSILSVPADTRVDFDTGSYSLPDMGWDRAHAWRYGEVTDKTSEIIDGPGYIYRSVPFHTDMVAQMNFSGLFAVRSGLSYPYTVWDGDGSVELADEQDLTAFCMGVMAHIETVRRQGKAVRDSLKDMTLEQLLNFTDPRS